jgi:uncharacterized membrane protein YraQ (UPF0718 family)
MASSAATLATDTSGYLRGKLLVQSLLASLLSVGIAAFFWIDSRYPSLLKKLHSGRSVHLNGALSFDALMPVTPGMSMLTRIGHTSVNWMWTNRIGMTFGVCFGAAMLTLLPLLPRIRFGSAAANTLAGGVAGVPLGVCANCVAPIGKGMYECGASPNAVLATMISSPTLNVVVLTMVIALFPLPVAFIRLAFPIVLLALVPWLVGKSGSEQAVSCAPPDVSGAKNAVGQFAGGYLKNLGRLALATIPLMVVAGVLGAIVAEAIPPQAIPLKVSLLGVAAVALIGSFLPVPIAFDAAAAFVLMTRGVPLPYVVTLLCTLGATGIYPFFILGRTISWATATRVFAAVAVLGTAAGMITAGITR